MSKFIFTYLLSIAIVCLVPFTGCPQNDNNPEAIIPQVTCTLNANRSSEVFLNSKIGAFFISEMNAATINAATFLVNQGSTPVAGSITYNGLGAIFTPVDYLIPYTTYTCRITKGVTDRAGNSMAADFVWTWTTGAAIDTTLPAVMHTVNPDGATDVYINTKIIACFSKLMDPSSITASTFTFMQGETPVPGKLSYLGISLIFTPLNNLTPNSDYTATIKAGFKDYTGNALPANYTWSWKTGTTLNEAIPYVLYTTPAIIRGTTHAVLSISATFNEPIDPLTITALNFNVNQGTTPVPGTVLYNDQTMTASFIPVIIFESNTGYTCVLTNKIKNIAGHAMANNESWNFTTALPAVEVPAQIE